ncbi:MAG: Kef-type K+ transport system membrane component KefB, partial [Myxococcota bacterium]
MRRLLVLAAALTIMWGLRGLPSATGGAGPDPLTLAAVGFVVLAAFTVGELGARLGLPKVTGYIVAGLALGPQAADILSTSVVQEMRVFNTLALGLIATTAGLELDLKSIRRVWKALTAMVVLKIPLLIVLVGGAFYAIESSLPSLGLPPEAIAPVALIVAVLGIGTSPAIALAVVNEGGSKGRLTDLLLAMAVVKDLVVVVSLAIALALAKAMLDPTAHLDAHVLVHVAEELGSSIAVGAVLGVLLIAYTRYVHKQMLLFILLTILVVAEISATLHLELLLVFIVAGFLVRNFSDLEHDLLHPLERIALPVFVVFFTTAGAGVDLIGTLGLLPLALSLVVARTLAFYLAGRMGGAIAGEGAAVVDNAWLTWLPQAGVTLGLVLLAAKALPDFAEPLTAIGMALVAIHLLVGPVTLGLGLRRAGEMGQAKAGADPHAHAEGSHDSPVEGEAASEEAHPSEPTEEVPATAEVPVAAARRPMSEVLTGVADPEAASTVRGLVADLQARIDAFVDHEARPAADAVRVHLAARVPDAGGDFFGGLRESALAPVELTHEAWLDQVNALYDDLARIVQALPHELTLAPQDPPPTHEARDPEGNLVALGRRARWLAEGRSWRRPPVGMLAREALEGRLAAAVLELSATWHRAQAAMCEAAAPGLLGAESPDLARTDIGNVEAEWVHSVRTALEDALLEGTTVLMDALVECASPLGRPRTPRYSEVESAVERARAEWVTDEPAWQDAVEAAGEHLRLVSIVAVLLNRTAELHQSWGQDALDAFEADLERSTGAVIERLTALKGTVAASTTPDLPAWEAQMKKVFPVRARLDLRLAAQTFRQRVQPARLSEELEAVLDNLPKRLRVVGLPVSTVGDVKDVDTHPLDVAATLRTLLLDARVPELCRALEHLTPQLVSCHSLVAECVEVASYGLSTAARDPDSAKASALEALERSIRRLELYRTELVEAIRVSRELLESEQQETEGDLRALLTPRSSVARITSGLSATRRIVGSRLSALLGRITAGGQWVSSWVTTRLEDPALLDRAVRSGARSMDGEQ